VTDGGIGVNSVFRASVLAGPPRLTRRRNNSLNRRPLRQSRPLRPAGNHRPRLDHPQMLLEAPRQGRTPHALAGGLRVTRGGASGLPCELAATFRTPFTTGPARSRPGTPLRSATAPSKAGQPHQCRRTRFGQSFRIANRARPSFWTQETSAGPSSQPSPRLGVKGSILRSRGGSPGRAGPRIRAVGREPRMGSGPGRRFRRLVRRRIRWSDTIAVHHTCRSSARRERWGHQGEVIRGNIANRCAHLNPIAPGCPGPPTPFDAAES
jgi:hypothetical protein